MENLHSETVSANYLKIKRLEQEEDRRLKEESEKQETAKGVRRLETQSHSIQLNFGGFVLEYSKYLEYLTQIEYKGCLEVKKEPPYLVTDFTDCVLFCLGRSFSKILVQPLQTHGNGNLKCSCSAEQDRFMHDSSEQVECSFQNFG